MADVLNDRAINYSAIEPNSLKNSAKINQTPAQPIKEIYWLFGNERIDSDKYKNFLKYGENVIVLIIDTSVIGIEYTITLTSDNYVIKKWNLITNGTILTYSINTGREVNISGGSVISGSLELKKNPYSPPIFIPIITMDIVPLIPSIMRAKGWNIASNCLNQWFKNSFDEAKTKDDLAMTTLLKMSWAISFPYVKTRIAEHIAGTSIQNQKSKNDLLKIIQKDITNGLLSLPVNVGDRIDFGHKDAILKEVTPEEKFPNFENYCFFEGHLKDVLPTSARSFDDFIAAVNECELKFIAFGVIRKVMNNMFTVKVESVGVYIWDFFEFNDNFITKAVDADLGFWNVKTNDVGKFGFTQPNGSTPVSNKLFRDWRERNKKGQDYTNFSDVKEFPYPFDSLHFKVDNNLILIP